MIAFGEFAPDVADLNTGVSSKATNVLPGVNSFLPLKSLSAASDALDNPCVGAVVMKDNDGSNYIFAGDKTKLYNISGATSTDFSQAGNYTDNAESWGFIKWGNKVIASKFGDTPQIMTLGGSVFADLGGTPPQGRTITTIREFVVMGNTWDGTDGNTTNRVRWSGFEDEDGWTVGTNQSDFQDLQGRGGAIQRIVGGEFGIVFQEKSIWRMTYVGTPLVFQFDEVEPSLGTPAGGSVVQYGSNIFYLGQDGFYALRNGTQSEPIGVNKVDRYFWSDVNQSYLTKISGAISPDNGTITWSYPSLNSNGELDKLIIYNFKTGQWSTGEIETQVLFQGATSAYTLEQLDAFGTVDTITSSLDSAIWKGGAFQLAAFDSSNQLAFFSGETLPATLETGEISAEGYLSTLTSVRPVIDGICTVTVSTRDNLVDAPTEGVATSVDSTQKANVRTHARYHRIKINTTGDFTHAQGVEPAVKTRGKR